MGGVFLNTSDKQEFHIPITSDGKTCIDWLAETTGFSRQKLKHYMQQGCVWLERGGEKQTNSHLEMTDSQFLNEQNDALQATYIQRIRRAKKPLKSGEILHFYFDEAVLNSEPNSATLVEDLGGYSIWNKPTGMFSQGSKWGDHCTINRWAEKHLTPERPAFIVHRLDRAANGLIILAHKKSTASQFSKMFEQRQVDKRYLVEVKGDFSTLSLLKDNKLTVSEPIDNKTAISHISFLSSNQTKTVSVLKVSIETGRKHQIRKHLAFLGFPVIGDRLYGDCTDTVDLKLSAKSLRFLCPISGEKKAFTLPESSSSLI